MVDSNEVTIHKTKLENAESQMLQLLTPEINAIRSLRECGTFKKKYIHTYTYVPVVRSCSSLHVCINVLYMYMCVSVRPERRARHFRSGVQLFLSDGNAVIFVDAQHREVTVIFSHLLILE